MWEHVWSLAQRMGLWSLSTFYLKKIKHWLWKNIFQNIAYFPLSSLICRNMISCPFQAEKVNSFHFFQFVTPNSNCVCHLVINTCHYNHLPQIPVSEINTVKHTGQWTQFCWLACTPARNTCPKLHILFAQLPSQTFSDILLTE